MDWLRRCYCKAFCKPLALPPLACPRIEKKPFEGWKDKRK